MGPGRGCSSPGEHGRKAVKGPPQRPVGAQLVGFFVGLMMNSRLRCRSCPCQISTWG